MDYFSAMLAAGIPNNEMHIYGNGRHPGDALPDGTRMSGGLTDRSNMPFGTWQNIHRLVPRSRIYAKAWNRNKGIDRYQTIPDSTTTPPRRSSAKCSPEANQLSY